MHPMQTVTMDGSWMDGWMDGRMDGRMDGLVEKWTVTSIYLSIVTARPLSLQVGPGSLTLDPN